MWKIIAHFGIIIAVAFITTIVFAQGTLPEGCIATAPDGRHLCWQGEEIDDPQPIAFDLTHWKLQIPGPKEIKPIGDYTSKYFYYGKGGEIVFWLDSSEKGTTPNSSYVRAELRETINPTNDDINWSLAGKHSLKAEIEVTKAGAPKITILQIHGVKPNGDNAPPLLKMTSENGSLYALIKNDNEGKSETKTLLLQNHGKFVAEILIDNYVLTIKINGNAKLTRSLTFWKHNNYFKTGLYPQAKEGISEMRLYMLEAKH